jgi:hypothetical protein
LQVRFSLFLITVEVVTARKEEVEGAETHEMDNLRPHINIASSLRSVPTGQDINDEEGVTSIWLCCRIPRRLFCSDTGGESDVPEMNTTSTQADICVCFLTIVEISMT